MAALSASFLSHLETAPAPSAAPAAGGAFGDWLARALELEDECGSLFETLSAYAYATYSTNTGDERAVAEINAVEELGLPLSRAGVLFRNALAARRAEVEAALDGPAADPRISGFAFHLRDELFWQSHQMSSELEDLAADLQRSGGDAWGRLQEAITSSASAPWPFDGGQASAEGASRKTLVELRSLAYDEDRSTRERAYRTELGLCESLKIPAAAALNGVKGFSVSLNARRGWETGLDKSAAQARVDRETLDALILAMEESLPSWRRYLRAKARLLGIGRCAFYDLFAPVGGATGAGARRLSFADARDFVVGALSDFDPAMGDFAARAFGSSWIDARMRPGKVGGAYCIDFPAARTSRVLCNFDGSFGSAITIAHELGHAWHAEAVRDLPYVYTQYPMTLAETASIFSETLAYGRALRDLGSADGAARAERTRLVELRLQDSCQVIVDILSRFWFERAVFERRAAAELQPDELCELMLDAQRRAYGDGLDPELLHPYMWLVKGHYYSTDLGFYNFPYAFGQLFGSALYARCEAEGPSFAAAYREVLRNTGRMGAADLASAAGFDIRKPDFWREGLGLFARLADELEAEAARAPDILA
jgi:pepF/M3 family oligoendopeptidase